jgi:YVTN family beta-propeller protein
LPCGANAYVVNSGSHSVSVIDTRSNRVTATLATGQSPVNPTFTPDWRQVYVANSTAGTLTVIDARTAVVSATIPHVRAQALRPRFHA